MTLMSSFNLVNKWNFSSTKSSDLYNINQRAVMPPSREREREGGERERGSALGLSCQEKQCSVSVKL